MGSGYDQHWVHPSIPIIHPYIHLLLHSYGSFHLPGYIICPSIYPSIPPCVLPCIHLQPPSCLQSLPRLLGASDLPRVILTRKEAITCNCIRKLKRGKAQEVWRRQVYQGPASHRSPSTSWLLEVSEAEPPLEDSGLGKNTEERRGVGTHRFDA